MNHSMKALAFAAFALAGTFLATAAQASANFNVSFAVQNKDASVSMTRTTTPVPTGITGLIATPSAIPPGGYDPASGFATWSGTLPALHNSASVSLTYAAYGTLNAPCTFTMTITHDTNSQPYLLQFASNAASRCPVPSSARTSDGQFTSQTYVLGWASA